MLFQLSGYLFPSILSFYLSTNIYLLSWYKKVISPRNDFRGRFSVCFYSHFFIVIFLRIHISLLSFAAYSEKNPKSRQMVTFHLVRPLKNINYESFEKNCHRILPIIEFGEAYKFRKMKKMELWVSLQSLFRKQIAEKFLQFYFICVLEHTFYLRCRFVEKIFRVRLSYFILN